MAKAKNRVIAGDYVGRLVVGGPAVRWPVISNGFKPISLNKDTVESYEVVTQEQGKNVASGVARGVVGGLLFGNIGVVAGAASAKNRGIVTVAVTFKDGKRSLMEIDDKVYKLLVRGCF